MKRGTNLDRRASFGRALPRLVPPPLSLFSSFLLQLRVTVPGLINARRIPLSFAPRKSVCSGPLLSLSLHGYLSSSRSCTATHGKWQLYCTRATLANPRTNTTVKMFGKCCVCGVFRLRTFLRRGLINDSLSNMAKNPRMTDRFARKLWKYGYRWNGSLFTTRLRVRSAMAWMRASRWHPCSTADTRFTRNFATRWQNQSAFLVILRYQYRRPCE